MLTIVSTGKYYGYTRVSSNKQARDPVGLEAQARQIEIYAEARGLQKIEIYEEAAVSANKRNRKHRAKLDALLARIEPGDSLIVWTFSRLARSLEDFLAIVKTLEDRKCPLVIIKEQVDTGSAYGRFTANLFAILGQLELELTAERNTDYNNEKRERGEFVGRIPYGWKLIQTSPKDKVVVEVEEEQKIIRYIRELYLGVNSNSGKLWTYHTIAAKLNEMKVPPPRKSKMWRDSAIKNILHRTSGPGIESSELDPLNYVALPDRNLPMITEPVIFNVGLNFYLAK